MEKPIALFLYSKLQLLVYFLCVLVYLIYNEYAYVLDITIQQTVLYSIILRKSLGGYRLS